MRRPSEEPPKPDDNFARLKEAAVSSVPVVGITAPILTFINYIVTLTTRVPLNSNAIEKLDSQIKGLAIKVDSQSIGISQIKELAIQVDSQIKGLAAIQALLVVLEVGAFVYVFNLVAAELRVYRSEQRVREDKILTDLTTLKTLAGLARSPAEADSPKQPSQKLR